MSMSRFEFERESCDEREKRERERYYDRRSQEQWPAAFL